LDWGRGSPHCRQRIKKWQKMGIGCQSWRWQANLAYDQKQILCIIKKLRKMQSFSSRQRKNFKNITQKTFVLPQKNGDSRKYRL
jgi:hypothetical protein